jgi:type III restriction enzyme
MATLASPVLSGPFDPPARFFEIGTYGPTGVVRDGRRRSESYLPIAHAKKTRGGISGVQDEFDFDVTGERREANPLINDLRTVVERWRMRGYPHVTPVTRNLLTHWADPKRENRVLFCQREAAETAIYLAEAAGRDGFSPAWQQYLRDQNAEYNAGLPRQALKMATGTGKTVVMAMLIAWQTINKIASPRDSRFAKRFLIVTPSITIRDRLRVLTPGGPGNYFDERGLVPPQYEGSLRQAQLVVTNYHAFLPGDAKEIKGVAKTTREILLGRPGGGKVEDPFKETPDAVVSRVLRAFSLGKDATRESEIIVLNDEAHHCYRYNPDTTGKRGKDEEAANKEAGVWFTGLTWAARRVGIKQVYDMSATPFFIGGSGYPEGYIFPWTVSDFSLMDAIESGIVKVPRTPVDDDAPETELVTYLQLWDFIGTRLPRRRNAQVETNWMPPAELQGALESLYRSYERSYHQWEDALQGLGEPPPVMIIVAPNTVVSKLVYEWVAGTGIEVDDGSVRYRSGRLPLFSNVVDGNPLSRPPSILIDSNQLDSGEALSKDFLDAARAEVEAFRAEYRRANPGADADALTEKDILREVMNTVGKRDKLGANVRCVVSVAMLTEGWDANTVTHILGIRAFGSQLLCEQVVGRGLRRRSWALNAEGRLTPEYANIYGIPFAFIPTTGKTPRELPVTPAEHVHAVEDRERLAIRFPRLVGYRLEIPDADYYLDDAVVEPFVVGGSNVPRRTETAGVVGEAEIDTGDARPLRAQELGFELAKRLIDSHLRTNDSDQFEGQTRPWLFPKLAKICTAFVRQHVVPGYDIPELRLAQVQANLADYINEHLMRQEGNRRERLRPVLRAYDPEGSTADVDFWTRKVVIPAEHSHVSHVVLDGPRGNSWEEKMADECERLVRQNVLVSYVKNDHLGFTIPYVYQGRSHNYVPDFLLRLTQRDGDVPRTLVVEVSGGRKQSHSPGPTHIKAETARNSWCAAVNNLGQYGRWGYVEVTDPMTFRDKLREAVTALYGDQPIIGDPDLLDFQLTGV